MEAERMGERLQAAIMERIKADIMEAERMKK